MTSLGVLRSAAGIDEIRAKSTRMTEYLIDLLDGAGATVLSPRDAGRRGSHVSIQVPDAAERLGIDLSTAWRWVLKGTRGNKLESFKIGSKRMTSVEAVERFVARSNAAQPAPASTTTQRKKSIAAAERVLAQAGI